MYTTTSVLVIFTIFALYIYEPRIFRFIPEWCIIAYQCATMKVRIFFLKRKLKQQIDADLRAMKKEQEKFTRDKSE